MSARDEGGAYARIRENLSELGLDAMAAGLPHWMSAVAAGEADFASAMLAMTSEEAEAKRRRGTDRKVRAAGFPFVKTLADFDFSFQPSIPRAVVDDLATLRFLDAAENVVLVGSPDAIDLAEDRDRFAALLDSLDIAYPRSAMASGLEEARSAAREIGYPLLVRPSYEIGRAHV